MGVKPFALECPVFSLGVSVALSRNVGLQQIPYGANIQPMTMIPDGSLVPHTGVVSRIRARLPFRPLLITNRFPEPLVLHDQLPVLGVELRVCPPEQSQEYT